MNNTSNSVIWDQLYSREDYSPIAPYTDAIAFLARSFSKQGNGKRLLEVGCGVGQNIAYAHWVMGFDIFGIDYSENAISLAKLSLSHKNIQADLRVGDASRLPYESEYFDVCIERAVIQCNTLSKGAQIINEIYRVLRPGGYLCCSINAEMHSLYGNGSSLGNGDFYDPMHDGIRHFYARRDIHDLFQAFNLLRLNLHSRLDTLNGKISEQYWVIEARKP
jgi:ubiquinone/menaquinone biosynthesis C-methylase UbiE